MKGLYHGDCIEVMRSLPENSVDTCITDPPYGLRFMGKEWDTFRQDKRGKNQIINMGNGMKQLNHIELVEFQEWTTQWAQAVYRVLKPGAIMLAFGGTRTYHRMVCAIEDAGFEIRNMIEWVYGSGFPKSLDIGKALDKQAGVEREVIGKELVDIGMQSGNMHAGRNSVIVERNVTKGNSGWDGWGTALKPSHEPIVLAMKPIDGTFANNALTWGVAGLWIDGGRVGTEVIQGGRAGRTGKSTFNASIGEKQEPHTGRFPANLIHDGSDEVLECFPMTTSGRLGVGHKSGNTFGVGNNDKKPELIDREYGNDSGSAARFFYCAKASRSERNAGLEGMEERKVNKLNSYGSQDGYVCPDGAHRVGDKGSASMQNHHPTVKPIELMRYLVRLTKTPTGGIVLDPFMGSGTTGCACALEGREFIGIEREAEYIEIANKRIAYWSLQPGLEVE